MSTTTNTTPTKPTDWHKRPSGYNQRCPICGCGHAKMGEHRAVAPEENMEAQWIRRSKSRSGWKYSPFGFNEVPRTKDPKSKPRSYKQRCPGPEPKTLQQIARACRMSAQGKTFKQIAPVLGVSVLTVAHWQENYRELWAMAFDKAVEDNITILREVAGTDAILQDAPAFARMASNVRKLLEARQQPLFPAAADGESRLGDVMKSYIERRAFEASTGYLHLLQLVVNRWQYSMGDPPLANIDTDMLVRFRDFLIKSRGREPGTVAKAETVRNNLRFLQMLLEYAGPVGRHNRDGLGILKVVPWICPPRAEESEPKVVSFEHLSAVYEKADIMTVPQIPGIDPANWWRALLVFTFNVGLRSRALFGLEWKHIDLEQQVVKVPRGLMKSRRAITLPLNEIVFQHLLKIHTDRQYVFEWPYGKNHLMTNFHRLQWAAGVPRSEMFGLHALRRTLATTLWEDNPAAAQLQLGHRGSQVTIAHYVQASGILTKAANELRQPDAFVKSNGGNGSNEQGG